MSGDINVQSFSGKVNISNNLLVGSSHLFVDTVNNRVGITTADPGASLEVNGNVHIETDLTLGGILTGDGSGLANVNSDSGLWAGAGTGSVYLSTLTDKVGIGTTSPSSQLELYGAGKDLTFKYDTGITRQSATNRDTYYSGLENSIKRVGDRNIFDGSLFTPDTTHEILFGFSDTYTQWSGLDQYYPQYMEMRFKLWSPSSSTVGSLTDVMTLRGDGNVGIGTTSPVATLDVRGSSSTSGIFSQRLWLDNIGDNSGNGSPDDNTGSPWYGLGYDNLAWNDQSHKYSADIPILSGYSGVALRSGAGNLVLTTAGNVGIGVTDPDVRFQVEGTSSSHQKLTKLATWNIFHHRDDGGFEHLITYSGSDGQAYFNNRDNFMYVQIPSIGGETLYTSTVTGYNSGYFNARFRDLNGNKPNLGENTTYEVHVYSSRIDAFGTITTTGNVGIGVTDPSYKLDVSGNLRVTTGILDTSWCSGSWLQTCTQSPTVTVYSNNGGGPMSTPGHGGSGMGGNRGRFTAKVAGNYLISCCAVHMGRGGADTSGTNLLVVFDAVGTNWDLNNVINTYDEIIDLRTAPTAEEAYTFACQVYMNVGHYFSFRVHSSGYIDNNAKLLCSAALVR